MKPWCLAVILSAWTTHALEGLAVEGNPHGKSGDTACCPVQRLPVETLLPAPLALARQQDTFVKAFTREHLGVPVDVFAFRQPRRLSHMMLPFDLALVSHVDPTGIVEVPTPPAQAADSWFPDYAWSAYVVCRGTSDTHLQHLGWRFSRKAGALGAGPDSFVALIVRSRDREAEAEAAATRSVRVSAVSATLREEDETDVLTDEHEATGTAPGDGGGHGSGLPVGVEAPGWMAAMVAAVTATAARHSAA